MILSSKVCYMVAGFDIAFSLLGAVTHQKIAFFFVGLAMLMNWLGDKKREIEKGEEHGS